MSIPSTIAEYLSCFSQELGDRILQIYRRFRLPRIPCRSGSRRCCEAPSQLNVWR